MPAGCLTACPLLDILLLSQPLPLCRLTALAVHSKTWSLMTLFAACRVLSTAYAYLLLHAGGGTSGQNAPCAAALRGGAMPS